MQKERERVAVVEIGGSHDECLLSQFVALKNHGCHVTFFSTDSVWKRNSRFKEFVDEYHSVEFTGSALGDFKLMRELNNHFKSLKIQKVVLNTAQGAHIRNLCLTASRKTEFIGIIHTLKKFQGSFTQKIIHRKIKKYFVLNDYFLNQITPPKGIQVESFYPLRFPTFEQIIEKPENETWITIIGGVEERRKDLTGSVALIESVRDLPVKFIFLGKSDVNSTDFQRFHTSLVQAQVESKIRYFDHFVSEEEFDAFLRKSDLIWPMVHPNTPSAVEYFRNQISGAMNVSFAYAVPMLVHQVYVNAWEDLWSAFGYDLNDFRNSLLVAIDQQKERSRAMINHSKFNPVFQEKKYLDFIFNA